MFAVARVGILMPMGRGCLNRRCVPLPLSSDGYDLYVKGNRVASQRVVEIDDHLGFRNGSNGPRYLVARGGREANDQPRF